MHILIANDDGYDADGIKCLTEAARDFGDVTVVAPRRNHSGASSSLTLNDKISVEEHDGRLFIVDGTPTDCVHLALTGGFFTSPPDLLLSGINSGSNMGDDTIYSGTVAAAIEGHLFDVPAFAFSMAGKSPQHYATGMAVVRQLVRWFCERPVRGAPLFNVNIPDVPLADYRGIMATRLGRRHQAEPANIVARESSRLTYMIGEAGPARDDGEGTDFYAVAQGYASITPLMTDLTAYAQMSATSDWLSVCISDHPSDRRDDK